MQDENISTNILEECEKAAVALGRSPLLKGDEVFVIKVGIFLKEEDRLELEQRIEGKTGLKSIVLDRTVEDAYITSDKTCRHLKTVNGTDLQFCSIPVNEWQTSDKGKYLRKEVIQTLAKNTVEAIKTIELPIWQAREILKTAMDMIEWEIMQWDKPDEK